jgi:hypothetical protein
MPNLRQGTVTVRGESFEIQELDGKSMRETRRILDTDRHRFEYYVASKGCVNPKLTEAELLDRPQIFADKISDAVLKITKEDDEKNA